MKRNAVRLFAAAMGASLVAGALCCAGAVAVAQPAAPNAVEDPLPPPSAVPQEGPGPVYPQAGATFKRLEGENRYATAKRISTEMSGYKVVVLASGENYADALAATPLAAAYKGPIVLTTGKTLHPEARVALDRARVVEGIDTVIIVGGTNTISTSVQSTVARDFLVSAVRIGGNNRHHTAALIADKVGLALQNNGKQVENVFVVDGTDFADALSASSAAAVHQGVILTSLGETLPPETVNGLTRFNRVNLVGLGGKADQALRGRPHVSIVGKDRYHTNIAMARTYFEDARAFAITSGESYPDALGAAALAAPLDGSVLLTRPKDVPAPLESFVRPGLWQTVWVCGGRNSVSEGVYASLYRLANP